jgi:hypothetical protein
LSPYPTGEDHDAQLRVLGDPSRERVVNCEDASGCWPRRFNVVATAWMTPREGTAVNVSFVRAGGVTMPTAGVNWSSRVARFDHHRRAFPMLTATLRVVLL